MEFVPYYCLHYIIQRILHIISRKSWYSMQTKSWWRAIPKIRVYLISRFYSRRENRENLMLAKYTCFTLCYGMRYAVVDWRCKSHTDWSGGESSWSLAVFCCREGENRASYCWLKFWTDLLKLLLFAVIRDVMKFEFDTVRTSNIFNRLKFDECFKHLVVECEFVEKSLFHDWFHMACGAQTVRECRQTFPKFRLSHKLQLLNVQCNFCSVMSYIVLIWTPILLTFGNDIVTLLFNWPKPVHYDPTDKIHGCIGIHIRRILKARICIRWMRMLTSFVTSPVVIVINFGLNTCCSLFLPHYLSYDDV